ncbi:MAG TPA: cation:proton antiporter [Thermoplasmata archaeon]|jgi:Kef-type K+ transport system membrane component KefB
MDTTTEFLVAMFLLVAAAILVGELVSRFGIPALVGQILVGVVLGPSLLGNALGLTNISTELMGIQFLATFFILMMAGLAVTPAQIRATGPAAAALGIAIFVVPFVGGAGIVRLLYPSYPVDTTLFISLTISITALPVLGIMLREFGLADTRFGAFLMNASVVNELAAVTTFAVLLRLESGTGNLGYDIATALATVGLFLTTILAIHMGLQSLRQLHVWDRWVDRFRLTWRSREAGFGLLMMAGLGAALYSQFLGLTFIVGAFYAGLLVTPESAGRAGHRTISLVFNAITWGFFIPLFFALVGFGMDFTTLSLADYSILAFASLALFAFFSKVFVGTAFARLLGWSPDESLCAGMLVSSRGAVELAMAVILYQQGFFTKEIYTVVAGVGLLTTLFAPIGAKPFVRSITAARRASAERATAISQSLPPRHILSDGEINVQR